MTDNTRNRKATAALVLGIVGLFTIGFTGFVAIPYAHLGLRASELTQTGRQRSIWGMVLGYIGAAFFVFMAGFSWGINANETSDFGEENTYTLDTNVTSALSATETCEFEAELILAEGLSVLAAFQAFGLARESGAVQEMATHYAVLKQRMPLFVDHSNGYLNSCRDIMDDVEFAEDALERMVSGWNGVMAECPKDIAPYTEVEC